MENKVNILLNCQVLTNEAGDKIKQASEQAGKDLENGIKNGAKRGADQASKSIKKIGVFDDLKNVLKGIKSGKIDVVTSAAGAAGSAGGGSGGLTSVIGMIGSLTTKLGAIGLAIGAVTSIATAYFSSKEQEKKNIKQSANIDDQFSTSRINRQQDAQQIDNKLMDQLEGLAKQTGLTAAEMKRAMKIIAELNSRYPLAKPSARVNTETGKIENFDEFKGAVKADQASKLLKEFQIKMKTLRKKQEEFFKENIASLDDSDVSKDWKRTIGHRDLYRNAYYTLKKDSSPEKWQAMMDDPDYFQKQAHKIYEEDEKLMDSINKAKDLTTAYQMAEKAYKGTLDVDAKRKKALFDLMEMLQQQMAVEKKIKELREAGLKQYQLEKALKAEATKRRVLTEEQQKQDNIVKNVRESDLSFRYSQLDNDSDREQFIWDNQILPRMGKVGNLEAENENLRGKTYATDKQRSADAQRLAQIEAQLQQSGLDQKTKEKLEAERTGLKTKVYGDEAERAKDTMTIARNETQILRLKGEIHKFEQQRQQLIQRQGKEYQKEADSMRDQLEVERLILQGRYEEARILKHINQMKNKGMGFDQQQQKYLEKQRKQQDALKFKKYLRGEAYSALDSMTPKTLQNDFQKKVREWEWANQTKMSQQQQNDLYSVMQHQYSQMTSNRMKTDLQNDISRSEIKTNDLTARGGFVGGAVEAPLTKINSNITNFQTMVNSNMTQLRTLMQRLGII